MQHNDEFIRDVGAKLKSQDLTIIKKYVLDQDLICKVGLKHSRVILPESILREFIIEIHELYAHIGVQKIYKMISNDLYAPNLQSKIVKLLKCCDSCQRTKYLTIKYKELYQPIYTNKPREILSIDFYGPLPTSVGGVQYILSTIDLFSKFVKL